MSEPYKFGVGIFRTRNGKTATVTRVRDDNTCYPLAGRLNDGDVESWTLEGAVIFGEECGSDLMPPEPEMVRVPLAMYDIPQGAEFRVVGEAPIFSLSWRSPIEIRVGLITMSYESLSINWEMRAPGGEWVPCWKEVPK